MKCAVCSSDFVLGILRWAGCGDDPRREAQLLGWARLGCGDGDEAESLITVTVLGWAATMGPRREARLLGWAGLRRRAAARGTVIALGCPELSFVCSFACGFECGFVCHFLSHVQLRV